MRPLIKHCEARPIYHTHKVRIDETIYDQKTPSELVYSVIKRTRGDAVLKLLSKIP